MGSTTTTTQTSNSSKTSRTSYKGHENDTLPSNGIIEQCASIQVHDADGETREFREIYSEGGGSHMVIFVRHFYCGMCQDYLQSLSEAITPEELSSQTPPIRLSIIGCGEPHLIKEYASKTGCRFPFYADPHRKLYEALGMISTLSSGPRPEYMKSSFVGVVAKGVYQTLSAGSDVFNGGSFSQVGGEFLFQGDEVKWCHRMHNTRDHSEISELRKRMGLKAEKA